MKVKDGEKMRKEKEGRKIVIIVKIIKIVINHLCVNENINIGIGANIKMFY